LKAKGLAASALTQSNSHTHLHPVPGYQPKLLLFLKKVLAFPRAQYSTNFSDLVSPNNDVQESYKDGLIALGCFMGGFITIWCLIILYLKCKGGAVGCASGRAFEHIEEDLDEEEKSGGQGASTDLEEMSQAVMEETSFPSSLCSSDAASQFDSIVSTEESVEDLEPVVEGRRAIRTRIAFFVFACIVLACVPLALAFSFAPMKDTIKSSDGTFEVRIRDVVCHCRR
jgi:hypothetical protein